MKTKFVVWLFFLVLITGLCGLVYVAAQQVYRQNANDPQIQIAQDAANNLSQNSTALVVPTSPVNVSESLSPFVMAFDQNGKLVKSNVILNGQPPLPPSGVFNIKSENRFTWQPDGQTRIAAVLVHYPNGYVLSGRNLREVETRIENLGMQIGLAWIFLNFFSLLFVATLPKREK